MTIGILKNHPANTTESAPGPPFEKITSGMIKNILKNACIVPRKNLIASSTFSGEKYRRYFPARIGEEETPNPSNMERYRSFGPMKKNIAEIFSDAVTARS